MRTIWAVSFLFAGACSSFAPQSCPAGLKPITKAELFFGRDIAGAAPVGDADWRTFLDTEVTPWFPDGLTVEDASGQWKGEHGIVREQSKHLTLVLPGAPDDEAKLAAIRAAYKQRFRQESVLVFEAPACAAF